jgi:predicted amidohydrolase
LQTLADLFCELYDALDEDVVRENAASWLEDEKVKSLAASFAADVESKDRPAAALLTRLANESVPREHPGEDRLDRRRYALLAGLDRAFAALNPALTVSGRPLPDQLVRLKAHLQEHGRLDTGVNGGALLPRMVDRSRKPGNVASKRDLFTSVVRVPSESWQRCELVRVPETAAIRRAELGAGLRVACVPVIADPREMRFRVRSAAGGLYYRIVPAERAATVRRIERIVAALDAAGAAIAVAPELTLSRGLTRAWQKALRDPARVGGSLRLVMAGTGCLRMSLGRAANTAVVLDGQSGVVVARQHKMFPFDFSTKELARWQLTGRLGAEPVAEDLRHGRDLVVLDTGGMRIAILICEDLAKLLDIAPVVRDLGVSHVLTPVFSRPLRAHRWEQVAAAAHSRETGTTVIVSNSLVMSRVLSQRGGTALVLAPEPDDALIAGVEDPAEPVCFLLRADGSAQAL